MVRPLVHRNTKHEVDYINYNNVIFVPEKTCKGCKFEVLKNEILCPSCCRDKRDNYKYVKVVK